MNSHCALALATTIVLASAFGDSQDVSLLQQSLEIQPLDDEVSEGSLALLHPSSPDNASFGASLRQACLESANNTECWAAVHQISPNAPDEFISCSPAEGEKVGSIPGLGDRALADFAPVDFGVDAKFPQCGETRLFYRAVWKAGSTSIWGNLEEDGDAKGWTPSSYSDLENTRATSTLFTFVREPISRFISGYAEIEFRGEFNSTFELGSKERARAFLDFTVSGECRNMHVGLQTNFLIHSYSCSATPFDFIGKLENFDEDWNTLAEIVGCELAWDSEMGEHSHPAADAADPMREVISDPDVMRQLCEFYLPDFLNFEYQLPEECADLYEF